MLPKTVFLTVVCLVSICYAQKSKYKSNSTTKYPYPVLFRDHVYYSMSENAKQIFSAVNIHPECVKKKGNCIPRLKCIDKKMLYISRVCYTRDLVCCYDDTIYHPVVELRTHFSTSTKVYTTEKLSRAKVRGRRYIYRLLNGEREHYEETYTLRCKMEDGHSIFQNSHSIRLFYRIITILINEKYDYGE